MSYDSADKIIERDALVASAAGGGATTAYGKFRSFVAARIVAAKAVVTTAGTATTHGFDLYNGTTSIGTVALSTLAAGVAVDFTIASPLLAALDAVTVKSLADAAGKADIVLQYKEQV